MLDLPGVVRLVDEGTEPRPFLVMERLFPGPVFRPGDPSWLPRLERVLGTLARVHGLGIVHRDIKPSNVMLDRERQPILVDFGIAQHRLAGEAPVSGTPRYMAPEQREGRSDARSDLYSLGRMVIEGITGVSAPSDPDMGALVAVGVAPRIAEVLCRCAATDPDRRPSGAYAVWRALSDRPPIVLPRRVTRRSVRALFVSRPEDRFIHAADDAAAEIERRARGSSVVEVIDEMLHQGLIGMEGDRLTVDRSAIRQWETIGLVDALGGEGQNDAWS